MPITLTVTETGEVTLDRELLNPLGVKPGEEIEAELDVGGS